VQAVQREKIDPQVFVNGALVPLLRKVGCQQEAAWRLLGCASFFVTSLMASVVGHTSELYHCFDPVQEQLEELQEQMQFLDRSLQSWVPYLNASCRYLATNGLYGVLYRMQVGD
jgi:hypothetical protein